MEYIVLFMTWESVRHLAEVLCEEDFKMKWKSDENMHQLFFTCHYREYHHVWSARTCYTCEKYGYMCIVLVVVLKEGGRVREEYNEKYEKCKKGNAAKQWEMKSCCFQVIKFNMANATTHKLERINNARRCVS